MRHTLTNAGNFCQVMCVLQCKMGLHFELLFCQQIGYYEMSDFILLTFSAFEMGVIVQDS